MQKIMLVCKTNEAAILISALLILVLYVSIVLPSNRSEINSAFLLRKSNITAPLTLITVVCRLKPLTYSIYMANTTNMRHNNTFLFPPPQEVDGGAMCSKVVLDKFTFLRFVMKDSHISRSEAETVGSVFCESVPIVHVAEKTQGCNVVTQSRVDITILRRNVTKSKDAYTIRISSTGDISIFTYDIAGVNAALSSLYQILLSPMPQYLPLVIRDDADSAWRGIMLDVARHFIPLQLLKRTVHAMWIAKLNVLHLHLTDSQSFPLLLDDTREFNLSQLARRGAHRMDMIYTPQDLRHLIEFAARRNITVVPEIDVPAHTWSWARAYPDIIINCTRAATAAQTPSNIYMLDITNKKTLPLVKAVLGAIGNIFPARYMHVGGDEVSMACLHEDPKVNQILQQRGISHQKALEEFQSSVLQFVRDMNKLPIVWQGVVDEQISSITMNKALDNSTQQLANIIVQPWKCWGGLATRSAMFALRHGYPVLNSACYYLDFDTDIAGYLTLKPVISDEHSLSINASFRMQSGLFAEDGVVGGEAAVWTEKIDSSNFECRVWPRAAAIASTLWRRSSSAMISDDYRYLLASYVRFRNLLVDHNLMFPAPITLHISSSPSSSDDIMPNTIHDEVSALSNIFNLSNPITSVTSQCSGISQATMRPWRMHELRISQLNVADGALGSRGAIVDDWMRKQANQGVAVIGLCEANGWHKMMSSSPSDLANNFPLIRSRAASAGFPFSHVLHSTYHPYNIGVIAAMPFIVVEEISPPRMQRGALHIYFKQIQLHVFIVHLHAHSSVARTEEVKLLIKTIHPLLLSQSRVVLMGDLNSLSPQDQEQHAYLRLGEIFNRTDHPVFERLRLKFGNPVDNQLNYAPIAMLQEIGLQDACVIRCSSLSHSSDTETLLWSDDIKSEYSKCMQQMCSKSEPTKFNPEWPVVLSTPQPNMRLDFIFVSEALYGNNKRFSYAQVQIDQDTDVMSDHYPMTVGLEWKGNFTFWR